MPATIDPRRAGQDALRAGRLGEAVGYLRRVLADRPGDASARIWLGQALCAGGHTFEGCTALRDGGILLCETAPDSALPIAALLQQQGDAAGSLAVADRVAALRPASLQAQMLIATAAAQTGAPERALVALEIARGLAPATAARDVLAASVESDMGRAADALARLDGIDPAVITPIDAFRIAKERARALDRLGRADEAFAEIARGAALCDALPEYRAADRALVPAILAADAAAFDAAMVRRWRDEPPADDGWAPLFVIGFLRSGTTLMQQILATDPQVRVADEEPVLSGVIQAFQAGSPGSPQTRIARLDNLDRPARAALRARYRAIAEMRTGPLGTERLVDKFTLNAIDLPLILRLFPEAPIRFMVRDPRDACISACLQLMPPGPSTVHMLRLADAARFHAAISAQWHRHRDALGLHYCEVRYEALVADLEGTMRRALAGTGIGWRDAMHHFHQASPGQTIASPSRAQVRQPLTTAKVAHWQRYGRHIAPVAHIFEPALDDWGY
ncbi:tetratricopeptide repeat-containing sulfotransferase family protein [Novosphingobium colocasiae]|uniref:tetratricopeptide repeat-containing sulfotransferase family protein n=1 Tax=Novosphingobium colocasiae TaxID=1256513 RepID=UPI001679577B|nr:sulfotransferase [Novosphingobium colocasiae]